MSPDENFRLKQSVPAGFHIKIRHISAENIFEEGKAALKGFFEQFFGLGYVFDVKPKENPCFILRQGV